MALLLNFMNLWKAFIKSTNLIDSDLYDAYSKMTLLHKLYFIIVHLIDRYYPWHKLPVFLGLVYLALRRTLHENYNLVNVGTNPQTLRGNPESVPYRTANGEFNDPFNPVSGAQGSFFGRNMQPSSSSDNMILNPHPSIVATKLLARRKLIDNGDQFNVLAASWIQFMIHDWVDHLEGTNQVVITAPKQVASECPLKKFTFYNSKEVPTGFYDIKSGHINMRTAWWDGSVLYGNNEEKLKQVRTFKDGKIKLSNDGLLQHDNDGIAISGDVRNSWAGVSTLQALFMREHNAICDMLKQHHPNFSDEELYRHARLVTSAVIAKIHTIDWTVELLKMDTLYAGLRSNWYGILGKKIKDAIGHTGNSVLSGFVGMLKPNNHGVPYSLTEEFVSVYRMHALLPDNIIVRDITKMPTKDKTPNVLKTLSITEMIGIGGEVTLSKVGIESMITSMGHQSSGALTLWNYPIWLRDLVPQDANGKERVDHVDLPALEIFRDRERHVARYNQFRRNMLMIPIRTWEDLTDDKEAIQILKDVYDNDIEKMDLLVGLMAEKKIKGYAISETAFHIFLLMASRRLEADRFFTTDFTEDVYTKEGLAWVNNTESLKDVLQRHFKDIVDKWLNASSAFSVWSAKPTSKNHIPLYLRVPS